MDRPITNNDYVCTFCDGSSWSEVNALKDKQKEAIHNFVQGHECANGVRENVVLCPGSCHSCLTIFEREHLGLNTSLY